MRNQLFAMSVGLLVLFSLFPFSCGWSGEFANVWAIYYNPESDRCLAVLNGQLVAQKCSTVQDQHRWRPDPTTGLLTNRQARSFIFKVSPLARMYRMDINWKYCASDPNSSDHLKNCDRIGSEFKGHHEVLGVDPDNQQANVKQGILGEIHHGNKQWIATDVTSSLACPPGMYISNWYYDCLPCPAGRYGGGGMATACTECGAQKFAPGHTAPCDWCPTSETSSRGSGKCDLCPFGSDRVYNSLAGCQPCPGKQWSRPTGYIGLGHKSDDMCRPDWCDVDQPDVSIQQEVVDPIGSYTHYLNTRTRRCVPGYGARDSAVGYTNPSVPGFTKEECRIDHTWGLITAPIEPGSTIFSANAVLHCDACVPGRYSNSSTLFRCRDCPDGYHSSTTRATECQRCIHNPNIDTSCHKCDPTNGLWILDVDQRKCHIDKKCYPDQTLRPNDRFGCQMCNFTSLPTGWSNSQPVDNLTPYQPRYPSLCSPNAFCLGGNFVKPHPDGCHAPCQYCLDDHIGCALFDHHCLTSSNDCGCIMPNDQPGSGCQPIDHFRSHLKNNGSLHTLTDHSCRRTSFANGTCTGNWIIPNKANGFVESKCLHETEPCTHSGTCEDSLAGECNAKPNTPTLEKCQNPATLKCDGRQNYNSYELFGVSHRCHTANLVRDACEIDVFCSGLASCQGATLQLPNLNLSTVQYDFDHTITDVRDIGLLRHMRKRFITSNRTLQIHASDIRVACGVITYLLEIRMGDSCHQGQPIWQLNTTDSGIHPVTLPGGPVPSNTTLHLLLGGRDQNGGIVYSPCIYSVRVDVTPPNPGRVRCGQSIEEDCRAFPSRDFIHISFDGESDPESDIQYGEFDVLDSKLNSLLLRPIRLTLWNIATRTVTIKFDHKASLGEHIIVIKRIYNQANLTSINQTLPIIMDDTPPVFEGFLFDCDLSGTPSPNASQPYQLAYQNSTDSLRGCVRFGSGWIDLESTIKIQTFRIEMSLTGSQWTSITEALIWEPPTDVIHRTSMTLMSGMYYRFAVAASNMAGSMSSHVYSPGTLVDASPPIMGGVFIQSVTSLIIDQSGVSIINGNELLPHALRQVNRSASLAPSSVYFNSTSLSMVGPYSAIVSQSWIDRLVIDWNPYVDDANRVITWHDGNGSGIKMFEIKIWDVTHANQSVVRDWIEMDGNTTVRHAIIDGFSFIHAHRYQVSLRATDRASNRMVARSNIILCDTTPPRLIDFRVLSIDVDPFVEVNFMPYPGPIRMSIIGNVIDDESGIGYYQVCVGRRDSSLVDDAYLCTYIGTLPMIELDPNSFLGDRSPGQWFIFTVRCFNRAGLYTDQRSQPFHWNHYYPQAGRVFDGPNSGVDIDYQRSTVTIAASWNGFTFNTTEIGYYEVAIGTSTNPQLVQSFRSVGLVESIAYSFDLKPLEPFETYIVTVKALKRSSLNFTTAQSNGVRIVTRAPDAGYVMDGSLNQLNDLDWQVDRWQVRCNWAGFYNQGVPIRYTAQVQSIRDTIGLDVENVSTLYQNVGPSSWESPIQATPLLGLYRVMICATNPVNLSTCVPSDGIMIDDGKPTSGVVLHGQRANLHLTTLAQQAFVIYANWYGFVNPISGVRSFEWSIGTISNSTDITGGWMDVGMDVSSAFRLISPLPVGTFFFIHVRCIGHNGHMSEASSDMVQIVDQPRELSRLQLGPNPITTLESDVDTGLPIPFITYVNSTYFMSVWLQRFHLDYNHDIQFSWALGVSQYGAELTDYQLLTSERSLTEELQLALEKIQIHHIHTYYVTVLAQNLAGLTFASSSNGCQVDSVPLKPVTFHLMMDPFQPRSAVRTIDDIVIHWKEQSTMEDPIKSISGLWRQEFAVVPSFELTTANIDMESLNWHIAPWVRSNGLNSNSLANGTVTINGLHLIHGCKYTLFSRTTSHAHLSTIASKEFLVDHQPPSLPTAVTMGNLSFFHFLDGHDASLFPGLMQFNSDIESCQSSIDHVRVSWLTPLSLSSIRSYSIGLGRSPMSNDVATWQNVDGDLNSKSWYKLSLVDGDIIYVTLKAENEAGHVGTFISHGLYISLSGPSLSTLPNAHRVWIGDFEPEPYIRHADYLSAHWPNTFTGPIHRIQWAIGTTPGGQQVQAWTSDIPPWRGESNDTSSTAKRFGLPTAGTASGLSLVSDMVYFVSVRASSCSGFSSISVSSPSRCDLIPPIPGQISLRPLLDNDEWKGTNSPVIRKVFNQSIQLFLPTSLLAIKRIKVEWCCFIARLAPIQQYRIILRQWTSPFHIMGDITDQPTVSQVSHPITEMVLSSNGTSHHVAEIVLTHQLEHERLYELQLIAETYSGLQTPLTVPFIVDGTSPVCHSGTMTIRVNSSPMVYSSTPTHALGAVTTLPFICVSSSPSMLVEWDPCTDSESGVSYYEISLMVESDDSISSSMVDSETIPRSWVNVGLKLQYRFEDLQLDPSKVYYVALRSTNFAGLQAFTRSLPIHLVDSVPILNEDLLSAAAAAATTTTTTTTAAGESSLYISLGDADTIARWHRLYPSSVGLNYSQSSTVQTIEWTPMTSRAGLDVPGVTYEYSIGTTSRGQQLIEWTPVPVNFTDPIYLSYRYGYRMRMLFPAGSFLPFNYHGPIYASIRVRGCSGLHLDATSLPIMLDSTHPTIETIQITSNHQTNGIIYMTKEELDQFSFKITGIADPESPIWTIRWSFQAVGFISLLLPYQSIPMTTFVYTNEALLSVTCTPDLHTSTDLCGTTYMASFHPRSSDPSKRFHSFDFTIRLKCSPLRMGPSTLVVDAQSTGLLLGEASRYFVAQPNLPPLWTLRVHVVDSMSNNHLHMVQVSHPPSSTIRPYTQSVLCLMNDPSLDSATLDSTIITWHHEHESDRRLSSTSAVTHFEVGIGSSPTGDTQSILPFTNIGLVRSIGLKDLIPFNSTFKPGEYIYIYLRGVNNVGPSQIARSPPIAIFTKRDQTHMETTNVSDSSNLPMLIGFGRQPSHSLRFWTELDFIELSFEEVLPSFEMPLRYTLSLGPSESSISLVPPISFSSDWFDDGVYVNFTTTGSIRVTTRMAPLGSDSASPFNTRIVTVRLTGIQWPKRVEGYTFTGRLLVMNCAGAFDSYPLPTCKLVTSPPMCSLVRPSFVPVTNSDSTNYGYDYGPMIDVLRTNDDDDDDGDNRPIYEVVTHSQTCEEMAQTATLASVFVWEDTNIFHRPRRPENDLFFLNPNQITSIGFIQAHDQLAGIQELKLTLRHCASGSLLSSSCDDDSLSSWSLTMPFSDLGSIETSQSNGSEGIFWLQPNHGNRTTTLTSTSHPIECEWIQDTSFVVDDVTTTSQMRPRAFRMRMPANISMIPNRDDTIKSGAPITFRLSLTWISYSGLHSSMSILLRVVTSRPVSMGPIRFGDWPMRPSLLDRFQQQQQQQTKSISYDHHNADRIGSICSNSSNRTCIGHCQRDTNELVFSFLPWLDAHSSVVSCEWRLIRLSRPESDSSHSVSDPISRSNWHRLTNHQMLLQSGRIVVSALNPFNQMDVRAGDVYQVELQCLNTVGSFGVVSRSPGLLIPCDGQVFDTLTDNNNNNISPLSKSRSRFCLNRMSSILCSG